MTKIALAAAVLLGSASLALAQYDGDANQIRGAYSVSTQASGFDNAFASSRSIVHAPVGQLDGDGNLVPGAR